MCFEFLQETYTGGNFGIDYSTYTELTAIGADKAISFCLQLAVTALNNISMGIATWTYFAVYRRRSNYTATEFLILCRVAKIIIFGRRIIRVSTVHIGNAELSLQTVSSSSGPVDYQLVILSHIFRLH